MEAAATGGKDARVRVEKSSGDSFADKIAVDYIKYLLAHKPELRAKNVANQLVFPLVIDAAGGGPTPAVRAITSGEVVFRRDLPGL